MFEELNENELDLIINAIHDRLERLKYSVKILKYIKDKERLEKAKSELDKIASLYSKLLMLRY